MKTPFHLTPRMRCLFLGCVALCVPCLLSVQAASFDHRHPLYERVLQARVKDALVDYGGLKNDRADLDQYLAEVAAVSRSAFDLWTEDQQLAFLLNVYNAYTLRLITDHYPLASIKDIGGLFSGPWDKPVVSLFGRQRTLDELEHKLIRPQYPDPRIHFALVCAAMGCPPLREEAYVAGRLDEQLGDQARRFLSNPRKNRVDVSGGTVHLSPIFKWYKKDFEKPSGGVLAAVKPYWPEKPPAGYERFRIRYTDYDWSLNDRRK